MRLTSVLQARYLQRYIERFVTHGTLRRQWKPFVGWKEIGKEKWDYGEHRPWTDAFKRDNMPGTRSKEIYVEPIKEWHVFKGDRVEILVGKDKGRQGLVNCIIKERNWVYVEGLNLEYKMEKHSELLPPVCSLDERPLLVTTQIKLVDPADKKPTDIAWRYTEEGKRVRVSVRTGRIIPLPYGAKELDDFINPDTYAECDKDSKDDEVTAVTFEPKLCTFEQDIMNSLGIKEERKRAKTYWY